MMAVEERRTESALDANALANSARGTGTTDESLCRTDTGAEGENA